MYLIPKSVTHTDYQSVTDNPLELGTSGFSPSSSRALSSGHLRLLPLAAAESQARRQKVLPEATVGWAALPRLGWEFWVKGRGLFLSLWELTGAFYRFLLCVVARILRVCLLWVAGGNGWIDREC